MIIIILEVTEVEASPERRHGGARTILQASVIGLIGNSTDTESNCQKQQRDAMIRSYRIIKPCPMRP